MPVKCHLFALILMLTSNNVSNFSISCGNSKSVSISANKGARVLQQETARLQLTGVTRLT